MARQVFSVRRDQAVVIYSGSRGSPWSGVDRVVLAEIPVSIHRMEVEAVERLLRSHSRAWGAVFDILYPMLRFADPILVMRKAMAIFHGAVVAVIAECDPIASQLKYWGIEVFFVGQQGSFDPAAVLKRLATM